MSVLTAALKSARWAALPGAALLGGCATMDSYAGIPLSPGAAPPEVQALAERARGGDKQAQLEFGIALEEGRGVPVDLGRARKLYAQAAADSGGTIWVYVPAVGNGTKGRVMPINQGPKRPGLAEARERLKKLKTQGN